MSDVAVRPRRIFPGFVAVLSLIALNAFAIGLHKANRTTLRGDEVVTLTQFLKSQSLRDLILKGAAQQVSPAPLLYLTDLTLEGYLRLPSLVFTTGLAFGAALVVGLRLRRQNGSPLQYLFVLCGLAMFLFHPKVFAFAGTERPYGLWTGLWLFLLAWLLGRPSSPWVP